MQSFKSAESSSAQDLAHYIENTVGPNYFGASDGMQAMRGRRLQAVCDYLRTKGFPSSQRDRSELSLVPFVFQEANYDDITWTTQSAELGHLKEILELDFVVQSGGQARSAASTKEFDSYIDSSFKAIDYWKARAAGRERVIKRPITMLHVIRFLAILIGALVLVVVAAKLTTPTLAPPVEFKLPTPSR